MFFLALFACAGCVAPVPVAPPAVPPPQRPPPEEATRACFNTQYRLVCVLPRGYQITDEEDGPGLVMTLTQRALTAAAVPASLAVKVVPRRRSTLAAYMDGFIAREIARADGVLHWEKAPAAHGAHRGIQVEVDRQYASGPFKSRIFGFAQGSLWILVDFTSPAETFDKESPALAAFAASIAPGP